MHTTHSDRITQPSRSFSLLDVCRRHHLLEPDANGVSRVPFLVRGRLIAPDPLSWDEIRRTFEALDQNRGVSAPQASYARIGRTQVLRDPIIDRRTMKWTGAHAYAVMPSFSPEEVIERDLPTLSRELYDLPFTEIQSFVGALARAFESSEDLIARIRDATLQTAVLPDYWHLASFAAYQLALDPDGIARAVDRELSAWGIGGLRLLDGWVELDETPLPAEINLLADQIFSDRGYDWRGERPALRAMPTRQLHITAGNAPQIPLISTLRAIATKSASVIKSPSGAILPGALLTLAVACAMPDHPLTKHMSIVYWKGGDEPIESKLFAPGSFDRVVVWGDPESVVSVRKRAFAAKVVTFNPRYAVSFIGRESFSQSLREIAVKSVSDSLIANQKACIASLVHYVEGDEAEVLAYAESLREVLHEIDRAAPNHLHPRVRGDIKRLQRGVFVDAEWLTNEKDASFQSGVVILDHEFEIGKHPMARLIVVRRVRDLSDALVHLHPGVSTVSIFPAERRRVLRDRIAATGVSNIVDLGQSGRGYPGMSHDGMLVLSELVEWKNG
jgi:hypothetical protein